MFLLGFSAFMIAGTASIEGRLDARYVGDSILADVRIIDFPQRQSKAMTLLLEPVADHRLPKRIRVTWFEPTETPRMGEVWRLELRLRRPRGASNPGGFRTENWQYREHLQATGYVSSSKRNRRIHAARRSLVESVRNAYVERVLRHDEALAPVLAAIGAGSRHLVPAEAWQRYAVTGTSHLMAISGLHIGLAAAFASLFVASVLGGLRVRGNVVDIAIASGTTAACIYALISGFAVPSQRAALMLAIAALALHRRRRLDVCRTLLFVALAIYCLDPMALLKPGFALSFAAVCVLLWGACGYVERATDGRALGKVARAGGQLVNMQLTLLFGLLPLTVFTFDRISWMAPLVNLLVVPVFSFAIVPLSLVCLMLGDVWAPLTAGLLSVAVWCAGLVEQMIALFASLPHADLMIAGAGLHPVLVVLPATWVLLPRGWPGRWLAIVAAIALVVYKPASPIPGCVDVHVLDVGQGLAVLTRSQDRALLYDTGAAFRNGGSMAESVILPFLVYLGSEKIDRVVISHGDNDHAGGLNVLLDSVPISTIFLGETDGRLARRETMCTAGDEWQENGIRYQFLYPIVGGQREGNDASCVLAVSAGAYRMLITGDIEAQGEATLVREDANLSADVVIVPHHGSLTSSSPAFVNRARPALAIASAAYGNHWGLPKERVVKRWQGAGATFLSTAESGAVSFRMCGKSGLSRITLARDAQRRFWYDTGS